MKLRYTPMQLKVLSVEEEDSPYHQQLADADSIDGTPGISRNSTFDVGSIMSAVRTGGL